MTTAIRAGWLWDGTGAPAIRDGVVVVDGELITAAGPAASTPIPGGATVIDRSGDFVMPGLIDAHTHITVRPGLGDQIGQLMQPVDRQVMRGVGNLRRMLRSGVTSARVMGEENWIDLTFKEQIAKGEIVGPKLIVSTRMITQSNGHGRALSAFDGVDEVCKASRENLYRGAEFLKLFITGGVSSTKGGGIRAASYSFDEMRVAVEEAERAFTYVAAHAIGGPGIRLGVEAGIRTIEHANMATDDDLALIKETGAWVVLTQSILLHPTGIEQGDRHNPVVMAKLKDARAQAAERLPAIVASGVRYAVGTDSMHGLLPFEAAKLVDWGVSNGDALLAVTRWAAECCRIEETTGTISPGRAADLIAIDGNPLERITDLERVTTIIKNGVDFSDLSDR